MLTQNDIDYLLENWGKRSILDIKDSLKIDLFTLLETAYKKGLHRKETENIGRRWTIEEDKFLEQYANKLSIPEACNLLYRSRYAVYQRAKFLQLQQMISKRLRD